jgi:hypothetical protein
VELGGAVCVDILHFSRRVLLLECPDRFFGRVVFVAEPSHLVDRTRMSVDEQIKVNLGHIKTS